MGTEQAAGRRRRVLQSAVAGAVAVWAMDRFDWFAFEHEDPRARRHTESVRPGGMDPAHALAANAAAAAGTRLKPAPPHRHPAGLAVHYALPMALAVLYDALKPRLPFAGVAKGAAYGAATFLILDELINPLLGLAARPDRYPWQRHARELATHMIFGAVTHGVLGLLDRESHERQGLDGAPPKGNGRSTVCLPGFASHGAGSGAMRGGLA